MRLKSEFRKYTNEWNPYIYGHIETTIRATVPYLPLFINLNFNSIVDNASDCTYPNICVSWKWYFTFYKIYEYVSGYLWYV